MVSSEGLFMGSDDLGGYMVKTTFVKGLQILVAIPTLAATLAAITGFIILHFLAGLHNEKI